MTTYYECHVTMTGDRETLKFETERLGWKFSAIDGDANLGDGVKLYATRQYNAKRDQDEMVEVLLQAARYLKTCGATILRRKVEVVLFDDRSSKVRCDNICDECREADRVERLTEGAA